MKLAGPDADDSELRSLRLWRRQPAAPAARAAPLAILI